MKKVKREIRNCACGCGTTFEAKITSSRQYISGHNRKGCSISLEHKLAISRANSGGNNPSKRIDVRLKKSIAATGKTRSLESIEKQRQSLLLNTAWKQSMKDRKPPRRGTKTSAQARVNMSLANKRKDAPTHETKMKISTALLKHFSIMENRIKRAKEIASRIQTKGYQYKTGYVELPRLGVRLFYRSSYEKIGLLLLDGKQDVKNVFVETVYIPYIANDGVEKIYVPDWLVETVDGDSYLIEVKPSSMVNRIDTILKTQAGIKWCVENNATYCIWTENIIFDPGSTTTSLQVIVEATANYPRGRRDSLACTETYRVGAKAPSRLQEKGYFNACRS